MIAAELGLSKQTVYGWIKRGRLKAYRVGAGYRICESDVREFIRLCNQR